MKSNDFISDAFPKERQPYWNIVYLFILVFNNFPWRKTHLTKLSIYKRVCKTLVPRVYLRIKRFLPLFQLIKKPLKKLIFSSRSLAWSSIWSILYKVMSVINCLHMLQPYYFTLFEIFHEFLPPTYLYHKSIMWNVNVFLKFACSAIAATINNKPTWEFHWLKLFGVNTGNSVAIKRIFGQSMYYWIEHSVQAVSPGSRLPN